MQWAVFVTAQGAAMGYALLFGLPILLMGASAFLGVVSLLFFTKGRGTDQEPAAIWLPVGVCAVAAISYLMSTSSSTSDFGKLYGSFLEWLWLWCAISFVVGLAYGLGLRRVS